MYDRLWYCYNYLVTRLIAMPRIKRESSGNCVCSASCSFHSNVLSGVTEAACLFRSGDSCCAADQERQKPSTRRGVLDVRRARARNVTLLPPRQRAVRGRSVALLNCSFDCLWTNVVRRKGISLVRRERSHTK